MKAADTNGEDARRQSFESPPAIQVSSAEALEAMKQTIHPPGAQAGSTNRPHEHNETVIADASAIGG